MNEHDGHLTAVSAAQALALEGLPASLLEDLRGLIAAARQRAATAVNAEMVLLYWQVGDRIRRDVLGRERAEYGQRVMAALSERLAAEYGKGFDRPNLFRMVQFAAAYPSQRIVVTLSRQLSWSHFCALIPLDAELQRDFYAEMCRLERWSVRTLRAKIQGMLYERTAISRRPDELARQELETLRQEDRVTPDLVLQDPYLLDFLGLGGSYHEKDLEAAILREMERFLLELGDGFTFVARQKRITVDHEDYYLDLLFYHRRLRRLVAIDLKLGRFQAADKGQMELYLRWLERNDQAAGEETPLGLILCAGKSPEHIELLRLDASGIHVAEYLTELPPRDLLAARLHQAIQSARARLAGPAFGDGEGAP